MDAECGVDHSMFRIFLVEDEGRDGVALAGLLGTLPGVEVIGCATSESAAIDELVADRSRWDMAIVDLALSTGSGLRVLSAGRVRRSHQRMVVLNDRLAHEMRRRCVYFGADAVFDRVSDIDALSEYCRVASEAAGRAMRTPGRLVSFFVSQCKPKLLSLFGMPSRSRKCFDVRVAVHLTAEAPHRRSAIPGLRGSTSLPTRP